MSSIYELTVRHTELDIRGCVRLNTKQLHLAYVPAQLDSVARFDPRQIGPGLIWRGSKRAKESQYGLNHKTIEQNELYDWMSLSYILLCNSLAFGGIQSIFGMDAPWHNRHQPTTLLLW